MPLQKLIGNIYSVVVEIILWVLPIVGIVVVCTLGKYYIHGGFLRFILGLIAGLLLDLILFGPVILLFNIRASLKNIENK